MEQMNEYELNGYFVVREKHPVRRLDAFYERRKN